MGVESFRLQLCIYIKSAAHCNRGIFPEKKALVRLSVNLLIIIIIIFQTYYTFLLFEFFHRPKAFKPKSLKSLIWGKKQRKVPH